MTDSLHWLDEDIKDIRDRKLFRLLTEIRSAQTPEIDIDGRSYILLSSNSYLGLTTHPDVVKAARDAVDRYGTGSGGSRLVSGSSDLHRELEERIARFKNTESAILFSSGYLANIGTISALMGKNDIVYSDELNHASIIDGCRLSGARTRVYRHADMDHLISHLESDNRETVKKLIVTDTVFSMDGDLAPLPELTEISGKYGCMLMIDEAHATGVLGRRGSGATEHFGVEDRIPVVMGTLSKAVGSLGGYVAGRRKLIDFLRNRARSYIFDTSLPASCLAASLTAINIIENEPGRRDNLWSLVNAFKSGLDEIGLSVLPSHSPIVPVLIGEAGQTLRFASILRDHGIYTPAVRPPSVPEGMSRIRATLMATHSSGHIERALSAFGEAYRDVLK